MLTLIPLRHFHEWIAFDSLAPIGDDRLDLLAGIISSTIANVHRGKNQRAYEAKDFTPTYTEEKKGQTPEEMAKILRGILT